MTTAGWIFMLSSWTIILSLTIFCLTRTVRSDRSRRRATPKENA